MGFSIKKEGFFAEEGNWERKETPSQSGGGMSTPLAGGDPLPNTLM